MNYRKLIYAAPPLAVVAVGTVAGAILLGIVTPVVLFLVAVFVFGDMGGPLFWPILVIFGLIVGAAAGFGFSVLWLLLFWLARYLVAPNDRQQLPDDASE